MTLRAFSSLLILLAVTGGTLMLVSCHRGEQAALEEGGTPVTGDWAILRLQSDPDTFNPLTTQTADGREIGALMMYESLIGVDNVTLQDMPVIADSLPVVSDDHLTYTYHLRKNVAFSDGHPVTGEDFVFTLKVIKDPFVIDAAPLRTYYKDIQKAELVGGDPYTVRFTLVEPYFLASQWCGGLQALPKYLWDPKGLLDSLTFEQLENTAAMKTNARVREFADWFDDPAKGRDPKFLVGSGRYIFESWTTGDRIVFRRNPSYWNAADPKNGKTYLDKIIYKMIQDDNAAITALKGGEIDFIPNVPKILFVNAFDSTRDRNIRTRVYDYPTMSYVVWNLHNPLFQDPRVRLALAKLMNTEEIIHTMLKGYARMITGSDYFRRPEYDTTIAPVAYDPEGARALLEQAGWKDTDGDGILDKDGRKLSFTFLSINSPIMSKILLIPIAAMRKAGIQADIQQLEFSVYVQDMRDHKFDASFASWATSVQEGDPYQIWHSSQTVGGSNSGFYNNPQVDALIEQLRHEFDWNKRLEIHKQIQRLIFNDQPYAFLYAVRLAAAWNARLQRVKFYGPRPCYDFTEWFVPAAEQKYGH